ncbi:DUF362 domain-containing protein [bacterium]|nr:DUF362 domain-containing protein [bacterium]
MIKMLHLVDIYLSGSMDMKQIDEWMLPRRAFLGVGSAVALGAACDLAWADEVAEKPVANISAEHLANAKVAVVRCESYEKELKEAYKKSFDLLGGVGKLVKGKTVTVKINLTGRAGQDPRELFGRIPGESYLTHGNTAIALAAVLFESGAKRVRVVESINDTMPVEDVLYWQSWEVKQLLAVGNVELENTRNLGKGKKYSTLPVPTGGYLFSHFEVNHSYEDTDVFISLTKLKEHAVAAVTLSMKNLFGITPSSKYGMDAGSEEAVQGRGRLHGSYGRRRGRRRKLPPLPGAKEGEFPSHQGYRVPHTIVDLCAARPIHLSIVDGITSMSGGEGYWSYGRQFIEPGLLIVGLNPVSTDAVAMRLMGYANPRAAKGEKPYYNCHNHILLAEQSGLGTAELDKIDVRGEKIADAVCPYPRVREG